MSPLLSSLDSALNESAVYNKLFNDFTPVQSRRLRYLFIRELEKGLTSPVCFLTYCHGSSIGNLHFIWKAPDDASAESGSCVENIRVIEEIKKELPVYHTRAMRKEFYNMYGRLTPHTKPYILRSIYQCLTGDTSASRTTAEEEIDERMAEALAMEDPESVVDLRELNKNGSDRYSVFWEKCNQYLTSCTSVHERRHDSVTFMAKAISVRDLVEEVSKLCPEETPIPSRSWVQLNFCPRNPHTHSAKLYTGRLSAKHMVQKRQFRKTHPDAHYCAAVFRYMRNYAVKYREVSVFCCLDDKHRIKVGEPGFPVAATERGREVIVSANDTYAVGDHDFYRFSLIPSVILVIDIPDCIEGSWYNGQVFVGIKEAVFEASSPFRHATELYSCIIPRMEHRHILFVYSDGGPDHRLTYVSVQLSLIALYLKLNLDVLIAARTAPSHSWANPVERIMSIVNIGMQCIGAMREKREECFEKAVEKCNSLKDLRQQCFQHKLDVAASIKPAKDLIANVMERLELKGKKFKVFESASDSEIVVYS